jgi:hypothetical protein
MAATGLSASKKALTNVTAFGWIRIVGPILVLPTA